MIKNILIGILVSTVFLQNFVLAEELIKQQTKYPDYAYEYLGPDKYEKFNRKVFNFNLGINKCAIRPIHIIWASVMPEYGMERINSAYKNIEYPKRLLSSLIQKDFKTSGTETIRFLTNSTIGLGGMFDPAQKFFGLEPSNEDMEQALTHCKCNSGSYLVLPIISGTTLRGAAGKLLDISLNPSNYIATPVLAMVKAGLTVNRTSYIQPFIKMVESTYADPYDIAKKAYGIDNYIKYNNYDRKEVLNKAFEELTKPPINKEENSPELVKNTPDIEKENIFIEKKTENTDKNILTVSKIVQSGENVNNIVLNSYKSENSKLMADFILFDYNPQNPVTDSMRTALFSTYNVNKSIWNELSIWNRSFGKKLKTSSINITPEKENYKFKYILQKNKNAPLAIIYPSIGEGICSENAIVLAKIFYDEGYSVLIQGSHFQWEFVKSMPDNYRPGIPRQDAMYLRDVTAKIIKSLEKKYDYKFERKTLIGTSFGAMTTLFLAEIESKNNVLNISRYISICPPIKLVYAMEQVDKTSEEWSNNQDNLKEKIAITAAKVVQLYDIKNSKKEFKLDTLPFSEEESKLITGFVMHQKLSDLIFTIEKTPTNKKTNIYEKINNINYKDYTEQYLLGEKYKTIEELDTDTSLFSMIDFLKTNNNYKIYHSLDDYLVNEKQLKELKIYSREKTTIFSNGSHLGFMYKPEFINELKKEISLTSPKEVSNNLIY